VLPDTLHLDERVERAGQLVVRARVFYDLWRFFKDKHPPAIFDAMQECSQYFLFEIEAQFAAFVVHLAAMFDKDRHTISLPRLAHELKSKRLVPSAVTADVQALLDRAAPLVSKLQILRSNLFAHRSARFSYSGAFEAANVTANQLRDLTDLSLKIANKLLVARGLRDQIFNRLPQQHAEAMLAALVSENRHDRA
jgi:hypothetical protein